MTTPATSAPVRASHKTNPRPMTKLACGRHYGNRALGEGLTCLKCGMIANDDPRTASLVALLNASFRHE